MTKRQSENDVLRPKDSAIANENEWPEFHLRNVEVVDGASGACKNLLHIDDTKPVTITGDLVLFEDVHQYLLPVRKSKEQRPLQLPLRIENVTHFSYGADENGDIHIWAAGDAGWYRLQPNTAYGPMFEQMLQAVLVFYYIADTYAEQPKTTLDELCAKYAREKRCSNAGVAKKAILRHMEFLLSRMEKGAEGIKWAQTPLYQHLQKMHLSPLDTTKSLTEISQGPKSQLQRTKSGSGTPVSSNGTRIPSQIPKRLPSRRSRRDEIDSDNEKKHSNGKLYGNDHASYKLQKDTVKARVNALWSLMQNVASRGNALTLPLFARAAYEHFAFDDEVQACDYIIFFAPELVSKIQHKHFGKLEWTESLFYSQLLDTEISRSTKSKIAQLNMLKRREALYLPPLNGGGDNSSSDEEVRHTRRSRHIKGGLRPKDSGKGTRKKGKSYTGPANHVEMDLDATSEASTPRKRKNTFKDRKPSKRTRSITQSSDATTPQSQEQDSEDDEAEDREPEEDQDPTITMPSLSTHENSVLTVLSTQSHDLAANAPGDQYSCPHPGCNHKVYGASSEIGQELISEHLAEHDEKMRLVVNEKNLTNLPVGNLIRRIREMAAFGDSGSFGIDPLAEREVVQRAF